jgi:hypothetical protein
LHLDSSLILFQLPLPFQIIFLYLQKKFTMKTWKEIQQAISVILWSIAVLSVVIGFIVYAIFDAMSFTCHCLLISVIAAVIAAFFTTSKGGGGLPFSY